MDREYFLENHLNFPNLALHGFYPGKYDWFANTLISIESIIETLQ